MITSIFNRGALHPMEGEGTGTGASGAGAGDWKTGLPEDLRGSASLGKFRDVAGLAKSYTELEGMLGSSIRPPGPDAGPEAHKAFAEKLVASGAKGVVYLPDDPKARGEVEGALWEKLGRPKEATGYKLDGVDLKGVSFSDEEIAAARAEAKELGLTAPQFAGMMARQAAARAGLTTAQRERQAALKAELGATYDDTVAEALNAAEQSGAPASVRELIKAGNVDKDTVLFFRNLGKRLGVQSREVAGQKGGAGGISKGEAEQRIAEILKNPDFYASGKPEIQAHLSAELARLEAIASPDLAG